MNNQNVYQSSANKLLDEVVNTLLDIQIAISNKKYELAESLLVSAKCDISAILTYLGMEIDNIENKNL